MTDCGCLLSRSFLDRRAKRAPFLLFGGRRLVATASGRNSDAPLRLGASGFCLSLPMLRFQARLLLALAACGDCGHPISLHLERSTGPELRGDPSLPGCSFLDRTPFRTRRGRPVAMTLSSERASLVMSESLRQKITASVLSSPPLNRLWNVKYLVARRLQKVLELTVYKKK